MASSERKGMTVNSGDPAESTAPSATMNGQGGTIKNEVPRSTARGKLENGLEEVAKAVEGNKDAKISGAELKKRAKEEKAARRAKEKQAQQPPDLATNKGDTAKGHGGKDAAALTQTPKGQHKRTSSTAVNQQRPLALRPADQLAAPSTQDVRKENKKVALFRHLYGTPRRTTIAGAGKDIHPAILALGLQMSSYVICGSNARCVATLLVFKRVREVREHASDTANLFRLLNHMSHLRKTPFLAILPPTFRLRLSTWCPVDHSPYQWVTLSDGLKSPYQPWIQIRLSLPLKQTSATQLTASSEKKSPLQVK